MNLSPPGWLTKALALNVGIEKARKSQPPWERPITEEDLEESDKK